MNKNEGQLQKMLATVAGALGEDLREQLVFVGGCTTVIFVTDVHAKEGVRFTDDVDLIADIAGAAKWTQLQDKLVKKGFSVSMEDGMMCRMRLGDLKVDFMPPDEAILGFTNRWYRTGIDTAQEYELTENLKIKLLTAPLFVATKLEAYLGRGNNDPMGSHDLEDILVLVAGRDSLVSEIKDSDPAVRNYIAAEISKILKHRDIESTVAGNVRDAARAKLIFERLEEIKNLHK